MFYPCLRTLLDHGGNAQSCCFLAAPHKAPPAAGGRRFLLALLFIPDPVSALRACQVSSRNLRSPSNQPMEYQFILDTALVLNPSNSVSLRPGPPYRQAYPTLPPFHHQRRPTILFRILDKLLSSQPVIEPFHFLLSLSH